MPLYRFKTTPFPHQRRAAIKAVKQAPSGGFLFWMDPRTGKTKAALDAIGMLALKRRHPLKVVIVCPLSAVGVWEEEIAEHYAGPCNVGVFGSVPYRLNDRRSDHADLHNPEVVIPRVRFFILNYEQYRNRRREHKRYEYYVGQAIEAWDPDIIAFDESHRLKRAGGVTAQFAWRSVRRMRNRRAPDDPTNAVFELTGTPNPKGWIDLFAQVRVMDDTIFGTAKSEFEDRHVEYGDRPWNKYTVVKYKRVKEIKRKVKPRSFIISRSKAFPDEAKQFWQNVPVTLPPKARRMYDEMAEELITEWEGGIIEAGNIGARRIRLQQITGGFTTDGERIHTAKLDAAKSLFEDSLEAAEPLVVYARFVPEVLAVAEVAERVGYNTHPIHGKVRRADRDKARRQLGSRTPTCLVFQVATGSLAIDLSAAGEVLFYSLPDGWLYYWQGISRLMGPKQERGAVRYRHLIARNTLDPRMLVNLKNQSDMHADLMGDVRGFLKGAV